MRDWYRMILCVGYNGRSRRYIYRVKRMYVPIGTNILGLPALFNSPRYDCIDDCIWKKKTIPPDSMSQYTRPNQRISCISKHRGPHISCQICNGRNIGRNTNRAMDFHIPNPFPIATRGYVNHYSLYSFETNHYYLSASSTYPSSGTPR